ncbi:hypothetical protein E2C01_056088 [Portunus trituberculatus]|uniref:Uncharacterized protein n=1 Tax=Portunus trituberculatus TaxID=210409 RepID=A0A5B7GWY1_PORTR|nr:hypothetical protein [Portunus trituberculatus]
MEVPPASLPKIAARTRGIKNRVVPFERDSALFGRSTLKIARLSGRLILFASSLFSASAPPTLTPTPSISRCRVFVN